VRRHFQQTAYAARWITLKNGEYKRWQIRRTIPKNSRVTDENDEKPTGYKSGGGNMGAGKSGKENLGSEKPTDDENMGSQKPGDGSKK
jgi:hypothetical protein